MSSPPSRIPGGTAAAGLSRRSLVALAASAALTGPGMRAAFADPAPESPPARDLVTITAGALSPGFTNLFLYYIIENGLDKRHGLRIVPQAEYTSLYSFHNDFASGTFDLAIGSWDTFATRYLGAVPIKLLCGLATADMVGIVVLGTKLRTCRDLDGKLLVANQGSGVWRMARAVIRETQGFDIESTLTVQNLDVPAAALSMVMADRADAALAWEPNISIAAQRRGDLSLIFNAGTAYREKFGLELPFFGAAVRTEALSRAPDTAKRLNAMFADCIADLRAKPDAITPDLAARTKINPDAIKAGLASNRVQFSFSDTGSRTGREIFQAAAEFLHRHGALTAAVRPDFFVDI